MWANESERTREVALRALRAAKEREEAKAARRGGGPRPTTTALTRDALQRLSYASDATSSAMVAGKFAGMDGDLWESATSVRRGRSCRV